MKTNRLILIAMLFIAPVSALAQSDDTYLSPMARTLKHDLEQLDRKVKAKDTALIHRYSLIKQCCTYYVPAFITLDHPYREGELNRYGVKVQSVSGHMVTALISTKKYRKLIDSKVAKAIEITPPARFLNRF